jgi:hypothetical protein
MRRTSSAVATSIAVAAVAAVAVTLGAVPVDAQRIPGWGRVAPAGGHQNDPQLLRPTGGPVVPMFEGWYVNPDGTRQLCFGYFNPNTEEVIDIPMGPDNFVEPAEYDGLQPTHFLPVPPGGRRHYCVMSVTVPADWGDRDVVWTLRDRYGQEYSVPGRTRHEMYHLEEARQDSRQSVAPKVRLRVSEAVASGRTPLLSGPLEARAGQALPLEVEVRRDNPFTENDRQSIGIRWHKYQGPGEVVFTPAASLRTAGRRTVVEAEGWNGSPDAWASASTEATFSEPGTYTLLLQAYNDSGGRYETSDLEFFCCWTNLLVEVVVGR